MKPTLPWMAQAFDEYNAKYFGGRLARPRFSLRCNPNYWGYYQPNATYNRITRRTTVKSPGTLFLNGNYSREERDWIGTMLHEMIHMYINTVMRKYPINDHGDDFYNIAMRINQDGWNISEANEKKSTDREVQGNEADERSPEERLVKPHIFCVINQPQNNSFKLWGFRADFNNLQAYISTAKRINGANAIYVYYCYSSRLNQMPTSPDNLMGVGANDYESLIRTVSQIIGERLTKENFNLAKTITL